MKKYLIGTLFLITFGILTGFALTSKVRMELVFDNFSYYIIAALVLLWVTTAVQLLRSINLPFHKIITQNSTAFVTALLLTLLVFFTVKTDFRTLSDETNLLSVSNSMFSQKGIRNVTAGKYYYDDFNPITQVIPRRQFIYPFFTSLLHTLVGFRATNSFLANYITLFFFLAGIFILIKRYTDSTCAVSALFLVLAQPVFSLYAASGGFDFINAFFFCLSFAMLLFYMREPSTEKLTFMWMTFLVASNIRYESIVSFLIAILGLVLFGYIKWKHVKTHVLLICITPLLMLPFLLQRILMMNNNENPDGVALFSIGHFIDHLKTFILTQFDFSLYLPYASVLNLISIPCIAWLFFRLIKEGRKGAVPPATIHFIVLFSLSILSNLFVIFCFYFGKNTHPVSARYFILISLVFSLAPLWLKKLKPNLIRSELLLAVSLALFFLYHPVAMQDRFTNTLTLNREFRYVRNVIDDLNDRRILIIYHRPGQFTATGYGAVNFYYANRNSRTLLRDLKRGLYSDIIVMQRIQYKDQKPEKSYRLSDKFSLQKMDDIQITGQYFTRISKVKKN